MTIWSLSKNSVLCDRFQQEWFITAYTPILSKLNEKKVSNHNFKLVNWTFFLNNFIAPTLFVLSAYLKFNIFIPRKDSKTNRKARAINLSRQIIIFTVKMPPDKRRRNKNEIKYKLHNDKGYKFLEFNSTRIEDLLNS